MSLAPVRPTVLRRVSVSVLALMVAGLHLVTGPDYTGPWRLFVTGYLIDILLPMVVFLLLTLPGLKLLARRWVIFLAVVALGAIIETMQGLGLTVLGRTFDPVDYVMYGLGAALGCLVDLFIEALEKRSAALSKAAQSDSGV